MASVTSRHLQHPRKTYRGTVLNANCEIEAIQQMEIRPDDVWVTTFPRSGTTVTEEIVYLVVTKDFNSANTRYLDDRITYIDNVDDRFPVFRGVTHVEGLPRSAPRFVKSHLHYFLLPEQLRGGKGKIIHVMRNPKDAIVSLYRLMKCMKILSDDMMFSDYFEKFMAGEFILNGPWGPHVREYWAHRNDPNLLLLRYEDIRKDLPSAIKTTASFLDQTLTEDLVEKIADHCSLENMKKNPMTNWSYWDKFQEMDHSFGGMINDGGIGTSKDWYTPEMHRRMDEKIHLELVGTGLVF